MIDPKIIETAAIILLEVRTWHGAWQTANEVERNAAMFEATEMLTAAAPLLVMEEREACAKVAEEKMGGYLCPYGRDKPGDPTWGHTDKDKCPVCGHDGETSLHGCHDTVSGRIAAAIRERGKA